MNQSTLNSYFATYWPQKSFNANILQYNQSGNKLREKVYYGERALDVGCGFNYFRPFIPNLIGIDPVSPMADHKLTIEQFSVSHQSLRFNVALCLGSINFGTAQNIENQIRCVVGMLRPRSSRIYFRTNTEHSTFEGVEFYPWTFEEHIRLAEKFGFYINDMGYDHDNTIYSEWIQKATAKY